MRFRIADALSFVVVTSSWLSSCSTQPGYRSIAQEEKIQGYGAPLTMDYQAFIRKWFSTRLKDPYSAVYTFSQPQKGYQAKAPVPFGPGGYWLGYRVDVMVNAKNSFGGYVGAKKYTFWFRDNQLLTISFPKGEAGHTKALSAGDAETAFFLPDATNGIAGKRKRTLLSSYF